MLLPRKLTTVTPLSKTLALTVFVTLLILAFLFGMRYQAKLDDYKARIPTGGEEQKIFCGGIMGKVCPSGYRCQYDGNYPDAGGTCIKTFFR